MIWSVYALACGVFYAVFVRLNVLERAGALAALFRAAGRVMADKAITDLEKEKRIRAAAIRSLAETLGLAARLLALLSSAALPVLMAVYFSALDIGAFVAFSLNPVVLFGTVLMLAGLDLVRRRLTG